jgi:hypothetical protein
MKFKRQRQQTVFFAKVLTDPAHKKLFAGRSRILPVLPQKIFLYFNSFSKKYPIFRSGVFSAGISAFLLRRSVSVSNIF